MMEYFTFAAEKDAAKAADKEAAHKEATHK